MQDDIRHSTFTIFTQTRTRTTHAFRWIVLAGSLVASLHVAGCSDDSGHGASGDAGDEGGSPAEGEDTSDSPFGPGVWDVGGSLPDGRAGEGDISSGEPDGSPHGSEQGDTSTDGDQDPGDGIDRGGDGTNTDTSESENPCEGALDGSPCNLDVDVCTLDVCAGGICVATGVKETCSEVQLSQPCWTFVCNPKSGCTPSVFIEGNSCNDGNPCTMNDTCQQQGLSVCAGVPVPTDDSNACTDDSCVGGVVYHTAVNGIPCEINAQVGYCEQGMCIPQACTAIDGGWSDWVLGPCDKACGGGLQSGSRTCTAPAPSCGGLSCGGSAVQNFSCNEQACPVETVALGCPSGVPFAADQTCLTPAQTSTFTKVVHTGATGDSYGVKVVRGPGETIAALYKQQEWFERLDAAGNVLQPAVRLPSLNPQVEPTALGDIGWPAFYGPEIAYNGSVFGVARPFLNSGRALFYTVDGSGQLVHGPLVIDPPSPASSRNRGPALEWTGSAWLLVWEVAAGATDQLAMARITANGTLDSTWGEGGRIAISEGKTYYHPSLAIADGGALGAVVWGESTWGVAILDLNSGKVLAAQEGGCSTGIGTNGDGHDITWNQALGEFGVLLTGQGAGLCSGTTPWVNAAILRISPSGQWLGSPLPALCGYTIGAGHRGGIAASPDGRYGVAMAHFHTKPFCIDGFNNGTQGVSALALTVINPNLGIAQDLRQHAPIPSVYTQVDVVWNGSRFIALSGILQTGSKSGYVLE